MPNPNRQRATSAPSGTAMSKAPVSRSPTHSAAIQKNRMLGPAGASMPATSVTRHQAHSAATSDAATRMAACTPMACHRLSLAAFLTGRSTTATRMEQIIMAMHSGMMATC